MTLTPAPTPTRAATTFPSLADANAAVADAGGTRRPWRPALLAVPASVLAVWATAVGLTGTWDRVADGAVAAVTMVFGSLVAGSTPQGGGAVAFPVFTKVLEVPAAGARTFSLSIQTVGMGTAAILIILRRLPIAWRALRVMVPVACVSFLATIAGLTRSGPFRPSVLPDDITKVGFTVVLAVLAVLMVRLRDTRLPHDDVEGSGTSTAVLVTAGVAGGAASAVLGSGADVVMFVALTLWFGVRPSVAVPTSVVLMATVSAVGLVRLGLADGQLLAPTGDVDLPALWLAAAPVVAVGAPVGSWLASKVTDKVLLGVVIAFAGAEVLSTALFLERVRTDLQLTAIALLVGAGAVRVLWSAHRLRFPHLYVPRPVPPVLWPAPAASATGARPAHTHEREGGGAMASPTRTPPIVSGVLSRAGQLNDPRARYCHRSGQRLERGAGSLADGPRPHLGVVCADDGTSHPLAGDLLVGRAPGRHHLVTDGIADPLVLTDDTGALSRAHLLLTLRGWDIRAADLGSSNGTWMQAVDGQPWVRLPVGEAITLPSGSMLACGSRRLRVDHLHVR
ncbi:MAG: TSUP family transporter [Acidimicrobiales bacterium]|nr:TSUP family transporter [Acidimicrobiales bacterium]